MAGQATVVLTGMFMLHMALICAIIAIATPHWIKGELSPNSSIVFNHTNTNETATNQTSMGLWEICQGSECQKLEAGELPEWFKAVQYQYTIGLGLCLVALIGEYAFFMIKACTKSAGCNVVITVLLMLTTALHITAVTIFGVKTKSEFELVTPLGDWSFFVAISGVVFAGLAAVANVYEGCLLSGHRAAYESI